MTALHNQLAATLAGAPVMSYHRIPAPWAEPSAIVAACERAGFRSACFRAAGVIVVIRGRPIWGADES